MGGGQVTNLLATKLLSDRGISRHRPTQNTHDKQIGEDQNARTRPWILGLTMNVVGVSF